MSEGKKDRTAPRVTNDSLIAQARIKKGMTQEELARRMGVSGSMVGTWERGARTPKLSSLKKIAAALGCSYTDLIED